MLDDGGGRSDGGQSGNVIERGGISGQGICAGFRQEILVDGLER